MKSLLFFLPAVLAASAPSFYLQIANGTHKGQYLTAPTYVAPATPSANCASGFVTWVNNLKNATIWTTTTYSDGGIGLALPDNRLVTIGYEGSDPSPNPILIGGSAPLPTACNTTEWGVQIELNSFAQKAPVGAVLEHDTSLTQYRAWAIVDGHVGISGLAQKGTEYIALQYLRVSPA